MDKGYVIINGQLLSTDELYHHGVKGMRWGVRKDRKAIKGDYKMRNKKASSEYERTVAGIKKKYKNGEPLSKEDQAKLSAAEKRYKNTVNNNKARYKQNKAEAKAEEKKIQEKRKHVDQMSDDELRKEVSRLQMEKQYKDLSAREVSMGEKMTKEILYAGGKAAGTYAVTATSKVAVDAGIKYFGEKLSEQASEKLSKAITAAIAKSFKGK